MIDVLVFNAIWFIVPFAALVVAVRHPDVARSALEDFNGWVRRRQRGLAILAFALVGAYFAANGAAQLL